MQKRALRLTAALVALVSLALLPVVPALARAAARAFNSVAQSLSTATIRLAPLTNATDPLPSAPGTVNVRLKNDHFFIKNFGTTTLASFSLTQSGTPAQINYCRGQIFGSSPKSYTKCADGSTALSLGSTASISSPTFSPPLAVGEVLSLAAIKNKVEDNKNKVEDNKNKVEDNNISVTVTGANRPVSITNG